MDKIAAVPGGFANTCVRGSYAEVPPGLAPLASLGCSPDVATTGASEVVVRQFRPTTGFGGHAPGSYTLKSIFTMYPFANLPPVDCAVSSPAIGPWSFAGQAPGTLACYSDETTGDALLYWSYDAAAILVRARNPKGDAAALYSFFDKYAKFIAP